jgi:hypothetical protein
MPRWVDRRGSAAHPFFNRIVRCVAVKGNDLPAILPDALLIAALSLAIATIALARYRRVLD